MGCAVDAQLGQRLSSAIRPFAHGINSLRQEHRAKRHGVWLRLYRWAIAAWISRRRAMRAAGPDYVIGAMAALTPIVLGQHCLG